MHEDAGLDGARADSGGAPRVIFPTLGKDFPTYGACRAGSGAHQGRRRSRHQQHAVPAAGYQGRREASGHHVCSWRTAASDDARLSLHAVLSLGICGRISGWRSQGYVVLSINYRSGVGYGRSFRNAPGTQARGNSEYQDVVAGAKYLQGRADVDRVARRYLGLVVRRAAHVAGAGAQLRHLCRRRGSGRRAPVRQRDRFHQSRVQVVSGRRDRRVEVAGVARARRRRSQCGFRSDGRSRATCCARAASIMS